MRIKMPKGTVKFWKIENGYGFARVEGERDVFVHISQVQRAGFASLAIGQSIEFHIAPDPKTGKDRAVDVRLIEPIISPKATPRAFHAEADDLAAASSHMELARQTFMQR